MVNCVYHMPHHTNHLYKGSLFIILNITHCIFSSHQLKKYILKTKLKRDIHVSNHHYHHHYCPAFSSVVVVIIIIIIIINIIIIIINMQIFECSGTFDWSPNACIPSVGSSEVALPSCNCRGHRSDTLIEHMKDAQVLILLIWHTLLLFWCVILCILHIIICITSTLSY